MDCVLADAQVPHGRPLNRIVSSHMDTRGIGALLLKVAGLILLLVAISQLPGYFPLTGRGYEFSIGEAFTTAALALGPLVVLGLVLWFFPDTLVNRIVIPEPSASPAAEGRPLELVAITLVGIYLLADGVISAVRSVVFLIVVHRQDAAVVLPASIFANIGATVAELAIGITLCIGAGGVSRVIERLRQ